MNLRLDDDRAELLKRQAEREGRSMHAIVLRALDDYLAQHAHEAMVRDTAAKEATKWRELMDRLK
ncbi:CopG family transcriptional regulator [Streptomyces sp. PT12]|nr:CopG family transcriptional regulator [Streptomyces sp. PT12]